MHGYALLRASVVHAAPCEAAAVYRVVLEGGGMDALVALGCGDMRRSLNILQVCCSATLLALHKLCLCVLVCASAAFTPKTAARPGLTGVGWQTCPPGGRGSPQGSAS